MKILLLGKNGQLGSELHKRLVIRHYVIALGRDEIDLSHSEEIKATLLILPSFDLLINATAYTMVDLAEQEERTAMEVNTFAPELLAAEAKRRHVPMIHFSTDYVFDGINRKIPYRETDSPNPLSIYGKTKLGGEIAVRETLKEHLILRVSALYGGSKGFVPFLLRKSMSDEFVKVVNDQIISPNWSCDIADAVVMIIAQIQYNGDCQWGTYHLSNSGETTWYGFAEEIYQSCSPLSGTKKILPMATTTADFNAAATRPAYSVLNADLAAATFGLQPLHWKNQFQKYLREKHIIRRENS